MDYSHSVFLVHDCGKVTEVDDSTPAPDGKFGIDWIVCTAPDAIEALAIAGQIEDEMIDDLAVAEQAIKRCARVREWMSRGAQ